LPKQEEEPFLKAKDLPGKSVSEGVEWIPEI